MITASPAGCPQRALRFLLLLFLLGVGFLAPRPAAAQTGSISGFVVDTLGNRISQATVRAISGPSAPREVRTFADGSYLLSLLNPGQYTFVAQREGFQDDVRTFNVLSGTNSRLDFRIASLTAQGAVLQGTVLRRGTTSPVSGALVQLTGGAGFPSVNTTTDSSGFYRFNNLPAGRVRIVVSREGFANASRQVTLTEGRVRQENFNLQLRTAELARLNGVITDQSGNAIRNARVTLLDGASAGLSDTTDNRGRYNIPRILPDVYRVSVSAAGFVTATQPGIVLLPREVETLNVTLTALGEANARINGLVVDILGNPIIGARVAVTAGPITGQFDITDATGAYELTSLVPGNYRLTVSATGFITESRTVNLAGGANLRIDFVLEENIVGGNGAISGAVTDGNGEPIANVTVRTTEGPVVGVSATTDSQGDYSLPDLPEGTYAVTFTRAGFTSRTVTGVEVFRNQTTPLDVTLAADAGTAVLTGTVTDTAGNPVSAATVSVFLGTTLVGATTSDTQGRFTVTGLNSGTYSVRGSRTGFDTVQVDGVVLRANETTQVTLRLPRAGTETGTISGLVLDPSNRPVQNAMVELNGPAGTRQLHTNAEGRFEFSNLPPGSGYRVTVTATGLNPETRSNLQLGAGEVIDLRFQLTRQPDGGGSVAGIVRGPNGLPIAGATVTVVSGPNVGNSRTTSADGRFNFTGLPGGVYSLVVTAPGFRSARQTVYARPGTSPFLIVTLRT